MLDAMLYTLLQWNHVETAVEKFCAIFDVVFFYFAVHSTVVAFFIFIIYCLVNSSGSVCFVHIFLFSLVCHINVTAHPKYSLACVIVKGEFTSPQNIAKIKLLHILTAQIDMESVNSLSGHSARV